MAYLSTVSVLFSIVVFFSDGAAYLLYFLAGVAVLATSLLLARVFRLTAQQAGWGSSVRYWMQAHVLLHLVPLSYLVLQFFNGPTLQMNGLYLLPVLLFFFSGRKTWQVFFEQFGSKMYRVFFMGNSGMMVGHVVLISLGVFYDIKFGAAFFCSALVTYFSIHLLILGAAVVKIERDLTSLVPDSQ
ncbi:MAG: hypothetical protein AB9Q22_07740 [Candidatus Reddybacter sp.]